MRKTLNLTESDVDEMARLYSQGQSTPEIGTRFNCLGGSVWARLKKRGVKLRRRGWQRRTWSITTHGYVRYGTQYLHRLVVSAWLGRPLVAGEVVHHRNGVRTDNRPDNLEVIADNGTHVGERHVRQWTPEDDWLLIRSRDAGATSQQIADALNIGKYSVDNRAKRLRRRGLTARVSCGPRQQHVPPEVLWAIREMGGLGVSTRASLLATDRNPGADIHRKWETAA